MESSGPPISAAQLAPDPMEQRVILKVMWRLIPFVVLLYLLNYLDRVNVAFAELQMSERLGFTKTLYGFAAGIFFLGYFAFEVLSNLIMERVGARRWMARIMITWGLISSAMMFIQGPVSFCTLRFILGVAEAGFAPGVILYLTYWLPARQQGRAVAWFLTATALSGVIGSPVAGLLLKLDSRSIHWPLQGWQSLFLLEGIPSVICGFIALKYLTDRPEHAGWLAPEERSWLSARLAHEHTARQGHGRHSLMHAMRSARVWVLNITYCMLMFGFQGINYWMPKIIKSVTGVQDNFRVGLLTAIPFAAAVVSMVIVGRHSDRTGERRWHVVICAVAGAVGLALCAITSNPVLAIAALALAAAGIWATLGPFWALPSHFLSGTAAAAGIAMVNSIGNLGGGFLGPNVMGTLWDRTRSYKPGLLIDAGAVLLAGVLVLVMGKWLGRAPREPGL